MQLENAGGTPGGLNVFIGGAALSAVSAWFFVDSVRVTTYGSGLVSRIGGIGGTGSMGIIFLPFFVGVVALFYDASKKWPWVLMSVGVAVIVVEILSRLRFFLDLKLSHFMIMLISFAAGLGLMLRALRSMPEETS